MGELIRPLVSVHRLVLLLPDMYHLLDPSVHSVAFSVDDFGLIPLSFNLSVYSKGMLSPAVCLRPILTFAHSAT